jgi:hypothetical protein
MAISVAESRRVLDFKGDYCVYSHVVHDGNEEEFCGHLCS